MISTQVEDPNSAWWAGIARREKQRRAATEARWAEQRAAHAASGFGGYFFNYETDFAGVRCISSSSFQVEVTVAARTKLRETYRDLHVAAFAHDIALVARGYLVP